jgi:proline iminopeptidase
VPAQFCCPSDLLAGSGEGTMAAMDKRIHNELLGIPLHRAAELGSILLIISLLTAPLMAQGRAKGVTRPSSAAHGKVPLNVYAVQEGYVDANGLMIYYQTLGRGEPLLILHGGPGASHDYFLPYLLPLARQNRLIFIDERGSGRSQKLEDPKSYTIENMVEDVELVRQALGLGKINLLGHSYGGALAQAYALKYQHNLSHLILASTWSSTKAMNDVFVKMKQNMAPELRDRIEKMEGAGLFGHGKPYEQNRYNADYMIAAWGEGYFPYVYANRPDPNYDPIAQGNTAWDLYRQMWGEHGEFVIDGNLKSVEYTDQLATIKVPTLIVVGEHDECDPSLSQTMQQKIAGAKLAIIPKSGHMTFVDQTGLFVRTIDTFLHPSEH